MSSSRLQRWKVVSGGFLLLSAFAVPTRAQEAAGARRSAVVARSVLPTPGEEIAPGMVLITDGRIEEVRAGREVPTGYEMIDASQWIVMAGLVDAHTHYGLRNVRLGSGHFDVAESSDPFTPQVDVLDAIDPRDPSFDEIRALGVTTMLVLHGSSNLIGGVGHVLKNRGGSLEAMLMPDAKPVLKMALGMNPKASYGRKDRSPKTRMAAAAMIRQKLDEAVRYRAQTTAAARDAATREREPDAQLEVISAALAGEMLVHIHAVRADDILTAVHLMQDYGLKGSLGHAYEGYLVASELAESGIPVVIGPKLDGWYRGTDPPEPVDVASDLSAAGVDVSIMTDSYVPDLFMQAAYAVHLGWSEEAALRAITSNPAHALGLEQRIGSLEPGKDADLLILDGEPLDLGTHVLRVLIEGETVFERPPMR